jgi:superfamily II DNA/RNA helicase
MISLPNRVVEAPQEQQNFEYLESIISQIRFADTFVFAEPKGTVSKIAVEDTRGNIVGYVPVYSE